jgi:hypothetical protein
VSLHLVIEDPTPEPTACPVCEGERAICDGTGMFWEPCFNCCCDVCGDTTETAPLCRDCDERQNRD